jgi:hypothetical protein
MMLGGGVGVGLGVVAGVGAGLAAAVAVGAGVGLALADGVGATEGVTTELGGVDGLPPTTPIGPGPERPRNATATRMAIAARVTPPRVAPENPLRTATGRGGTAGRRA